MKRYLVIEITDETLACLAGGKRVPGTIGLAADGETVDFHQHFRSNAPDGETVDFHQHFRSNAPRPKRRRIDIPCAGGVMSLYIPDTLLN